MSKISSQLIVGIDSRSHRTVSQLRRASPTLLLFLILSCFLGSSTPQAQAATTIESRCSTTQVRKGQLFHIYLEISTQENIDNINIQLTLPTEFKIVSCNAKQCPDLSGIGTSYLNSLSAGSSFLEDFLVQPPSSWHLFGDIGGDTRETKIVVFNVSYETKVGDQVNTTRKAVTLNLPFALAPVLYMLMGMIGLIVGHIIKTLTSNKLVLSRLAKEQPKEAGFFAFQRMVFGFVFRTEGLGLLSTATVGFIILLVLSRAEIPVKGWYDSLALGVTLAILADQQLLTKLKG